MALIDWDSKNTEILLNPRLPNRESYHRFLENTLTHHVWFSTSGTSGKLKFAALSKEALLTSAQAVNEHLESDAADTWIHALPDFHVGGVGIWARAHLSGASVIKLPKWDPFSLQEGTLSALVPTQVYDLVSHNITPPPTLRAVIVGGGRLSESLYQKGRALGWPLLPSYGLTECASQVATAKEKELIPLAHVQLRIVDHRLAIKSPSLLTTYAMDGKLIDPKEDGWFLTEDFASLGNHTLHIKGRSSDFVKIGGESVDLTRLEDLFEELKEKSAGDAVIMAVPDERLGHVIHAFYTGKEIASLVEKFNTRVLPFERIRHFQQVEKIPRTDLHKVVKSVIVT